MAKHNNFLTKFFKRFQENPPVDNTQDKQQKTSYDPNLLRNSINIINSLLNDSLTSVDTVNNNRQYRYHEYEMIMSRIPEQNRALSLIQDLVLNPTELNTKYINVELLNNDLPLSYVDDIELLIDKLKLEDILPRIVFDTLLYGDCFVEIQDSSILNLERKFNNNRVINIVVHDPKDIIIINDKNDNVYGYIEVNGDINDLHEDFFDNKGEDYNNIIKKIEELNQDNLLYDNESFQIEGKKDLQFRYIPLTNMSQFSLTNNNMFYPYGTSYFEPVRSIQNIIILIELSTVVYRLVRQPGHMKYKLDVTGIDPTQYPQYIQTMKQMIRSEKTVNPDLSSQSLDETVKLVTMFDDYWIPVRNNVPIYDLEWLQGDNLNVQIEDLNYLHKKLLSALGLPPSYLGFEEPLSGVQTVLVIQDQRVQRIINKIQKDINKGLNDLIYKVSSMLDTEEYAKNVVISLNPVKSQDEDQKLDMLQKKASLLSQLSSFGMNKEFLLKEIMGYTDEEVEKQLKKDKNEENNNEINEEF